MSDAISSQSLSEDIAFVRALAVEGQQGPFRGEVSLAAGLIWGTASLYSWSVVSRLWDPPGGMASAGWVWGVAALAFCLVGVPLRLYRARADGNRVAAAAWGGVGLACWTINAAIALAAWRMHSWVVLAVIPPMIMALYGGGWMVSAVAFRQPWQKWIGSFSLLASLALGAVAGQIEEYLLFALALYLLAALPGLIAVIRDRNKA